MQQKWKKLFERENGLNRVNETMQSLIHPIPYAVLRPKITPRALCLRLPNGNDAFYINPASWAGFFDCIKKILINTSAFNQYIALYNKNKKNFISVSKKMGAIATKRGLQGKLLDLYTRYQAAASDFILVVEWGGFFLPEYGEKIALELVKKISRDPEEQEAYLKIILSSPKLSAIRKERRSILKIALEQNKATQEQLLLRHTQRFSWIPCINVFTPPWEENFFKQELATLPNRKQAEQELSESYNYFTRIRRQFKKLALAQKPHIRAMMNRAQTAAFLKDNRDDIRRKARFYAIPLYRAIAKALSIPFLELEWYTIKEIVNALTINTPLSKNTINERGKGYAIVAKGETTVVKTGAEYENYLANVATSRTQARERKKTITGIGAASGVQQGTVCLVPNASSLDKVKRGDILVTVATHPDYLPAMRRATAIITDEGGLTSHAAIVCRELGIPCVVGTRVATAILRDGDVVKVDGESGKIIMV